MKVVKGKAGHCNQC